MPGFWHPDEERLLSARFLYIELFDLQIQRRARNSEFGGRTIWPGNFSIAFRESRFDEILLVVPDVLCEKT